MTSILGFTRDTAWDKMDGVQYYRTYLPLREINRQAKGMAAEVIGQNTIAALSDDDLGGRDIYTMARMYGEGHQEFVQEIHGRGGALVLDSDDDLTETYRLVSGRGAEFKEVLGQVDYVTVSTQYLADLFSQYTKRPPTVLKNCVDVKWMVERMSAGKRVVTGLTIGFSGSPTHWGDWYLPAIPFQRIVKDFDVAPILHGEVPRYLTYCTNDRVIKLAGVPFSIYPVALSQFDIVLCAVDVRDGFSLGKSSVKALEAMVVGAVPICSPLPAYQEIHEQGAPVVMIEEDSRDGWYEAMRKVVSDEAYRQDLVSRGREWVYAHRDMTNTGYKQWEKFYLEIAH